MAKFPAEIFHQIARSLTDRPTLYTLLFVSREFHYQAELLLYHRIDTTSKIKLDAFSREVKDGRRSSQTARLQEVTIFHSLFQRLTSAPHLARCVQELIIQFPPPKLEEASPKFLPSVAAALRCASNLSLLELHYQYGAGTTEARSGSILRGCTFPHLIALTLSNSDVTQDIGEFISRHPGLVSLTWQPQFFDHQPRAISVAPFPALETVRTDGSIVDPLLDGQRTLKRLQLFLILTQGQDYFPRLTGLAGSRLQVLDCSACDIASHIDRIAAIWSNDLRYLSYSVFSFRRQFVMLEQLSNFNKLEVIRIFTFRDAEEEMDRFASELFTVNPSVQIVKIDTSRDGEHSFQIRREDRSRSRIVYDRVEWLNFPSR